MVLIIRGINKFVVLINSWYNSITVCITYTYIVVHTILTPSSAKQALYRGYCGIGDMYPTLGALGLEDPGIHSVKNDYKSKIHTQLM